MTKAQGIDCVGRESLSRLVKDGHLEREEAMEFAVHPDDLKSRLRGVA